MRTLIGILCWMSLAVFFHQKVEGATEDDEQSDISLGTSPLPADHSHDDIVVEASEVDDEPHNALDIYAAEEETPVQREPEDEGARIELLKELRTEETDENEGNVDIYSLESNVVEPKYERHVEDELEREEEHGTTNNNESESEIEAHPQDDAAVASVEKVDEDERPDNGGNDYSTESEEEAYASDARDEEVEGNYTAKEIANTENTNYIDNNNVDGVDDDYYEYDEGSDVDSVVDRIVRASAAAAFDEMPKGASEVEVEVQLDMSELDTQLKKQEAFGRFAGMPIRQKITGVISAASLLQYKGQIMLEEDAKAADAVTNVLPPPYTPRPFIAYADCRMGILPQHVCRFFGFKNPAFLPPSDVDAHHQLDERAAAVIRDLKRGILDIRYDLSLGKFFTPYQLEVLSNGLYAAKDANLLVPGNSIQADIDQISVCTNLFDRFFEITSKSLAKILRDTGEAPDVTTGEIEGQTDIVKHRLRGTNSTKDTDDDTDATVYTVENNNSKPKISGAKKHRRLPEITPSRQSFMDIGDIFAPLTSLSSSIPLPFGGGGSGLDGITDIISMSPLASTAESFGLGSRSSSPIDAAMSTISSATSPLTQVLSPLTSTASSVAGSSNPLASIASSVLNVGGNSDVSSSPLSVLSSPLSSLQSPTSILTSPLSAATSGISSISSSAGNPISSAVSVASNLTRPLTAVVSGGGSYDGISSGTNPIAAATNIASSLNPMSNLSANASSPSSYLSSLSSSTLPSTYPLSSSPVSSSTDMGNSYTLPSSLTSITSPVSSVLSVASNPATATTSAIQTITNIGHNNNNDVFSSPLSVSLPGYNGSSSPQSAGLTLDDIDRMTANFPTTMNERNY